MRTLDLWPFQLRISLIQLLIDMTQLLALALIFSPVTLAFVRCQTQAGTFIHHDLPPHLSVFAHSKGNTHLTSSELFSAVSKSFQRWQEASQNEMKFNYWQGDDPKLFPTTGNRDDTSSLFFLSQADSRSPLTSYLSKSTLGMTQLWYDLSSGKITEFDIILNDLDFEFTNHPEDSSGSKTPRSFTQIDRIPVFIENVITHEIGHALGLSHSGALQATMLFSESPEQAHLGCDDQIGIQTLTSNDSLPVHRGGLRGQVVSPSGKPILGAHVLAISIHRGTVFSTTLTDLQGFYQLDHLEPGPYSLLIEPFFAGSKVLPEYYEKTQTLVCQPTAENPQPFLRAFLAQKDSDQPQAIEVKAHKLMQVETTSVQCPSSGARLADRNEKRLSAHWITQGDSSYFNLTYETPTRQTQTLELGELSGALRIYGLSYTLYSPLQMHFLLFNENRQIIPVQIKSPIDTSNSGFTNYDIKLEAQDLPKGRYFLEVSHEKLTVQDYPAGLISLDSRPFVLILGTLNRPPLLLGELLPDHPRCKSSESFDTYQSPPLSQSIPNHSPNLHTPYNSPSPGCTRAFLPQTLKFSEFLFTWMSWIFCFLFNYFILKLFKHLLTLIPIDKLKLWD